MCGIMFVEGKLDRKRFESQFDKLVHRGPDEKAVLACSRGTFGFHRLAIIDPTPSGMQPFVAQQLTLVCNGEIYNEAELRHRYADYPYQGHSDCEVLLPLYLQHHEHMAKHLDGEFAFVLFDQRSDRLLAARDPLGIRPLFYGKTPDNQMAFASEVKALIDICDDVKAFPIGYLYDNGTWIQYCDVTKIPDKYLEASNILGQIKETLTNAVSKRLMSDVPVGFLLSGGLDSSLVCAIAAQLSKQPLHTFAIGMREDAIDLKYAAQVAQHIGSIHHEIMIDFKEVLEVLPDVIYHLESFDVTTIRASLGMFLLARAIHRDTDIKVLLTGEVSDELFGYKYTDFAPSADAFNEEAQKRLRELYAYDVLRADRCLAAWSLEARVPFSDLSFIQSVMGIDPKLKLNTTGMGKYLLRKAFDDGILLPHHILWREKAAFSDAVGHSLVDLLKAQAETRYSQAEFQMLANQYEDYRPQSKEALWYRSLFDSVFPAHSHLIPGYWMPNPQWVGSEIQDPSARYLSNYNQSGV